MLVAAIITGVAGLVLSILWIISVVRSGDIFCGNATSFWLGLCFNISWLICFLTSMHLAIGSQQLNGYIYSSSNKVGYTTAHIRFGENAGKDSQPSFCVRSDSKPGRAIEKYVGTGKKVKVNIQPYFYFANNPFACGTTDMTVEEVK